MIGILEPKGQSPQGQDQDDVVYVPITTAQKKLVGTTRIGTVGVILVQAVDVGQQHQAIARHHRADHALQLLRGIERALLERAVGLRGCPIAARDWQERSEGRNSNEIAAQTVATQAIGRQLDRSELAVAAALTHYTFGCLVGALYGAYAERRTREATGIGFGLLVWLLADEAHVATLATHPDFRRQGIAKKLLSYALRHLIQEGARSSFLEVRESNLAAQQMYREFGYEETGRRHRYYKDNNEDAILMTLRSLNIEHLTSAARHPALDKEERNE